ncbi:MAG: hypothetical protein IPH00_16670 [Flavobacteriales bacterium]|nr:hypothetical protein [Flavobacteriales bacterium]
MRYLVHSKRTGTQLTLGYDERGLLCEMLIEGAADAKGVEWLRLNSPVLEQEVMPAFQKIPGVTVRMITVDFAQFWRTYPRKDGKKAERVWNNCSNGTRQLAYDFIKRHCDKCAADGIAYMYPATYLRAERWLDNL